MAGKETNKTFTIVGELTEDCQFLTITHYKPLKRILQHMVGKPLEISFKLLKYVRSEAQNRWLWGVAYIRICAFLKETLGEKIDKETVHAYTKQVIMGGKLYDTVAIQKDEFLELIDELLNSDKNQDELRTLVKKNLHYWLVNVKISEVLNQRIIVDAEEKSTKTLNTKEFCDLKDTLQAHWAEKGCDIPDPRENNLLSDYTDD